MSGYRYEHKSSKGRKISSISMTEPDSGPHKSSLQNQIIACLICNLGSFSFGSAIGWSSPSLEKLVNDNFLTEEESAWTGGLLPLGALVSLPIFGYVARTRGRKPAAYVVGIPLAVGFAMKAWGNSSIWLLIGRFLCGLGGGGALSLPPLYVGETCEPRGRGFLSSMMMGEYSIGLLMAYILGDILPDVELLPVTLLPVPIIFMIAFWFMPETPIYRLRMGQEEEAARALAWLRKLPLNSVEVKEELTQMATRLGLELPLPSPPPKPSRIGRRHLKTRVMYLRSPSQIESSKTGAVEEAGKLQARRTIPSKPTDKPIQILASLKQLLSSKVGSRALGLCLVLITAQTFMGLFAVSMYASFIFKSAGTVLPANLCAILYAVVVCIGSVSGSFLMDKAGRRVLQISTCIIVSACEVALAVSLQAVANNYQAPWMRWLPLIALPICVLAYNMGAGNIPFVLISELFVPEVQDVATNLLMAYIWLSCFLLLQFFPACVAALGLHVVFYGFAGVSFVAAVFSYFFLIETKGKSLEEILLKLSGDKKEHSGKMMEMKEMLPKV